MSDKSDKSIIKKIILAAGLSKRYGLKNKLTQHINNKPIINCLMDKLLSIYDSSELLICLLYTSTSPRDKRQSRMPSSA